MLLLLGGDPLGCSLRLHHLAFRSPAVAMVLHLRLRFRTLLVVLPLANSINHMSAESLPGRRFSIRQRQWGGRFQGFGFRKMLGTSIKSLEPFASSMVVPARPQHLVNVIGP